MFQSRNHILYVLPHGSENDFHFACPVFYYHFPFSLSTIGLDFTLFIFTFHFMVHSPLCISKMTAYTQQVTSDAIQSRQKLNASGCGGDASGDCFCGFILFRDSCRESGRGARRWRGAGGAKRHVWRPSGGASGTIGRFTVDPARRQTRKQSGDCIVFYSITDFVRWVAPDFVTEVRYRKSLSKIVIEFRYRISLSVNEFR